MLLNTEIHEILVVYQLVWRNMVVFAHNSVVLIFLFMILERRALLNLVFLLPILGLVAFTLVCPMWLISRLVYRIPTLRSLIPPIFQFLFFLTPVLWTPSDTGAPNVLIEINPVAWLMGLSEQAVFNSEVNWKFLLRLVLFLIFSLFASEFLFRRLKSIKTQI